MSENPKTTSSAEKRSEVSMRNLMRAVRMALRFKFSLVLSLICSLMVAALWAANITAVYPVVDVVFQEKDLHIWMDEEAAVLRKTILEAQAEINHIQAHGGANARGETSRLATTVKQKQARLNQLQMRRRFVEKYAPRGAFRTLIFVVAFLMLGTLLKCTLRAVSDVLMARIGKRVSANLRRSFFRARLSNRTKTIDIGNTAGRIAGDVGAIGNAIQSIFGRSIQEPLKLLSCLVAAAIFNWRLLAFSMVAIPVAALLLASLARAIRRASLKSFDERCMLIGRMVQTFRGVEVVKAYNMESHEGRRFWQHSMSVYREQVKIAFFTSLVRANNEMLGVAAISLSVIAGGHLVLNQQTHLFGIPLAAEPMTPAQIMTFFALIVGCSDPLRKLSDVYGQIQGGAAAADRVIPIIDEANIPDENPGRRLRIDSARRDITFENVTFAYNVGRPVLRDISFDIKQGETLAIIGPNGCGKSTLIKLLLRFADPDKGSIRLGETDIHDIHRRSLRKHVALVTQRPVLFNDTIENNIRYGAKKASQVEVVNAAIKAHAHEFITTSTPHGYETSCGDFGANLSGGQQQRISVARAILRDPDILILDEASSQIDPKSEELIHDSLREFVEDRTAIMITHRMSTLSLADRIMVMERGQIVDIGTHEELMGRCRRYQLLRELPMKKSA